MEKETVARDYGKSPEKSQDVFKTTVLIPRELWQRAQGARNDPSQTLQKLMLDGLELRIRELEIAKAEGADGTSASSAR